MVDGSAYEDPSSIPK